MSARTLKIRSEQNGLYSKKYLTRMRFTLPQDLMTTDAGNSYLSLQTQLMTLGGVPIDTKLPVSGQRRFFGFGNDATAYSPSCMIRTAKLFSQLSNKVIEEINYSNLRTANFESLQGDIDTFGSSTSFNGAALSEEIIRNIQDNWSQWTSGGSQELHIRLKDLFPSLNTAMYSLKQSPLIIDLEMEVNRDLINVMYQNALIQEPPTTTQGGGLGYVSTSVSPASCLVQAQVNTAYKNVQTPNLVQAPMVWVYQASNYAGETIYDARDANGNVLPTPYYIFNTKWAEADFAPLGFPDENVVMVQAMQQIKDNAGNVRGDFMIVDTLKATSVGINVDTATFEMNTQFQAVRNTYAGNTQVELNSLNPYIMSNTNYLKSSARDAADSQTMFESLRDTKSFVCTADEEDALAQLGLIANPSGAVIAGKSFLCYLKLTDNAALTTVATDEAGFSDAGVDYYVSNQSIQMPRLAPARMTIQSFDTATKVLTFTQDLTLKAGDGVNALGFFNINTEGAIVPSVFTSLYIFSVQDANQTILAGEIVAGAYPEISKAEIVLKQYPAIPNMKMPSIYRTFKCEPFNIATGFAELVQNFELEPNVYNAYVILPFPTAEHDLMSYGKGVAEWRATIDDIDLTNVNVLSDVTYPSTLYYDRLIDTFANSQMALRCLDGRVVGKMAGKTRIIPIKIYESVQNGQVVMSPSMKRLQVRMLAKAGSTIAAGTAFLFKELYQSY